jgi:hypothetical protein
MRSGFSIGRGPIPVRKAQHKRYRLVSSLRRRAFSRSRNLPNDRSLTASDTKTRSLKPDGACQIEYRIIHSNPRAVGFSGAAPSITMGSVIPRAIGHRRALAGFPIRRFILATTTSSLCLLRLSRRHDGLDVAEVCGAVTRMHCSRAGARSRRDRLYTRSTAREIVRRERLITTSSGK